MVWHSSSLLLSPTTTKTTLFYLLLYYLISTTIINVVHGQLESDGCLLLSSSKACPAFSQYYIGLTDQLKSSYSFLSNVNDVTSFDSAMFDYTSNLQQAGCNTNNNNDTQQQTNDNDETYYPRYSLSRLCALLVHDATGSLPCNYGRGITPVPLCQSTCNSWVDSLENMTSTSTTDNDGSTAICPSSVYGSLVLECSSWPAFAGINRNCILGSDNEPDNCGKDSILLLLLL
ncbi:hypothetical protein BDA99DRAFT_441818 [Phascolomyces articulosus]|uniref:Uncharacterized protein n=1 Tax=Phascolomyces articulosus TaxID=60185 RepID=A0AAD5PBZ7_9FUNG|nr:hypothetical protein BDA99DRAFT_441818 [Phascolomyces articulosus]